MCPGITLTRLNCIDGEIDVYTKLFVNADHLAFQGQELIISSMSKDYRRMPKTFIVR